MVLRSRSSSPAPFVLLDPQEILQLTNPNTQAWSCPGRVGGRGGRRCESPVLEDLRANVSAVLNALAGATRAHSYAVADLLEALAMRMLCHQHTAQLSDVLDDWQSRIAECFPPPEEARTGRVAPSTIPSVEAKPSAVPPRSITPFPGHVWPPRPAPAGPGPAPARAPSPRPSCRGGCPDPLDGLLPEELAAPARGAIECCYAMEDAAGALRATVRGLRAALEASRDAERQKRAEIESLWGDYRAAQAGWEEENHRLWQENEQLRRQAGRLYKALR